MWKLLQCLEHFLKAFRLLLMIPGLHHTFNRARLDYKFGILHEIAIPAAKINQVSSQGAHTIREETMTRLRHTLAKLSGQIGSLLASRSAGRAQCFRTLGKDLVVKSPLATRQLLNHNRVATVH